MGVNLAEEFPRDSLRPDVMWRAIRGFFAKSGQLVMHRSHESRDMACRRVRQHCSIHVGNVQ